MIREVENLAVEWHFKIFGATGRKNECIKLAVRARSPPVHEICLNFELQSPKQQKRGVTLINAK